MLKDAQPSDYFLGAILRAYDKASEEGGDVSCSKLWDYVCMECFHTPGGFVTMFQWDESKAKNINRIGTIAETIRRGHVPGLILSENDKGREIVVRA